MRRAGTQFWQEPTALYPPMGNEWGGGSAREAPTHSPTDQHKGEYERKFFYGPSPQNPLLAHPLPEGAGRGGAAGTFFQNL